MTDNRFTLYYFPGSYYSQKAVLGLLEKGCKFNKQIVAIHDGGNRDPEYMRMNPDGKVPVLKDGQKVVIESEKIIDYIDEEVKSGTKLVPDPSTPFGKEVKRLREYLGKISIEVATYGVITNPEFSVSGVRGVPKFYAKRVSSFSYQNSAVEALEKAAEKYPDLRDAYLKKAVDTKNFFDATHDKVKVAKVLDDIDQICDHLEECLKKTKAAVPEGQEFWIAGPQFTAADIVMVIFMDRMVMLGLEDRYFSKEKRPLLNDYQQRIGQRKSVQQLRADVSRLFRYIIWSKIKTVTPYVVSAATLGVAIGMGIFFLKKK